MIKTRHIPMGLTVFLLMTATLTKVSAQRPKPVVHFASGSATANIPLDIDNNIIRLKVRINGSRPLLMIFDTGASVTIIHTRIAQELGLKKGRSLAGTGTGGPIRGNLAGKAKLSVEGAEVTEQLLFSQAYPLPPGFDFDGILGYDFIRAFVVELDYQKKIMRLYDPASYKYSGDGHVVRLDLKDRRTPLVDTAFTFGPVRRVLARLELDTGADGTFLLNSPFVDKHGLLRTQGETRPAVGRGAGGEQRRVIGIATAADVGTFKFKNVPIAFSMDHNRSETADGIVGGEVLRRFRLIIDYSHSHMILDANSDLGDPFELDDSE